MTQDIYDLQSFSTCPFLVVSPHGLHILSCGSSSASNVFSTQLSLFSDEFLESHDSSAVQFALKNLIII